MNLLPPIGARPQPVREPAEFDVEDAVERAEDLLDQRDPRSTRGDRHRGHRLSWSGALLVTVGV